MSKLKIVYCIPSLYIHGGMERVVTIKANYLAEVLGHKVYIIMTDAPNKKPFFELSSKVEVINLNEDFEQLWGKPFWKKALLYGKLMRNYKKKLTKCLIELKPDITVSMLRREINFLCNIEDGSKKIGEIHIIREEFRKLNGETKGNIITKFIQYIWNKELLQALKKLDFFVVLTKRDQALWREIALHKIDTISNPLPFYIESRADCTAKSVVIVARYCHEKGFDRLFPAWKKVCEKHPDWTLHIYGDDGPDIRKEIESYGIEPYCKLYPPTEQIEKELVKHSIFVLSSRFEGFGMVLCEAMACGIPCVAFNCHYGPSEIIRHNEDGLLIEDGNREELAKGIITLIENETLRKQFGAQAHKNIERYHITKIGKEWEALFYKLTQQE
ncbi:MAG: glycosyltransferase family 4 protein [Phocaeicola sp.]